MFRAFALLYPFVFALAFQTPMAFSFGSGSTDEGDNTDNPDENVQYPTLKFLSSVQFIETRDLLPDPNDEQKFQDLIVEQYEHLLASSKGFVVSPITAGESQFYMRAKIIAFELISDSGLRFGFTPVANFSPISGSLDIKVKKLRLSVAMDAVDPETGRIVASTIANSEFKDSKTNLGLRYQNFISASFVSSKKTPLSDVTGKALQQGADDLSQKVSGAVWKGEVLSAFREDTHHAVKFNGGFDVGVQKGMKFEVVGKDGSSQGRAKAVIEIYRVNMTSAWGKVTFLNPELILEPIDSGDYVYHLETSIE